MDDSFSNNNKILKLPIQHDTGGKLAPKGSKGGSNIISLDNYKQKKRLEVLLDYKDSEIILTDGSLLSEILYLQNLPEQITLGDNNFLVSKLRYYEISFLKPMGDISHIDSYGNFLKEIIKSKKGICFYSDDDTHTLFKPSNQNNNFSQYYLSTFPLLIEGPIVTPGPKDEVFMNLTRKNLLGVNPHFLKETPLSFDINNYSLEFLQSEQISEFSREFPTRLCIMGDVFDNENPPLLDILIRYKTNKK